MKRGIFFYILIVVAVVAVGLLIWALAPGESPDTPPVYLSPPPAADASEVPATEAPVSDRVIVVTPETVQTVISTLSRADSYSRTLTVQNFWDGGSSETEIDAWVRGENTRLNIHETGREKYVLIRDGAEWIWYSDGNGVWHGSARDGDADAWQTLLTYEDVLALDESAILDAGFTEYNGENCIFVRYISGILGYESLCYISDSTGLLMGTETYDGDVLIYTMRSTAPDVSTPEDEYFAEP